MQFNYFKAKNSIKIHDKIIEISGGRTGLKNYGNIDSPLEHIQNDEYYPTFEGKLTHLVFSFNKFHAFNDGNKRTSIAVGAFFLEVNGLSIFIDKFIIEMENIAVAIADNLIDKDLLLDIIKSIINDIEFSEELKLKIIYALSQKKIDGPEIAFGAEFYKDLY